MKAKINGIEVEGTPEEILEFNLKMEKHINQLVFDMKKYSPLPTPSVDPSPHLFPQITSVINHSKCISVPIQKSNKIMDVDYGRGKTNITIKDIENKTIQATSFTETDNLSCKSISEFIVYQVVCKNIDYVHIDNTGVGMGVYDHLMQSQISDKVIPFTPKRF
ncbi:hypothetical protein [Paenibacillus illinoisensis]|uniref:Uncharacterized protein n=1 Tax=Paenibacillus illinoisensis TaxID=59845 RepID=A0A2W0C7E5_9BACL|nr:hypothetical protein [Paenibacillus illinoisensis]PYY28366.1 hypothetical protein PIL02S_03517 [Paenibacillus illinoisensis]